MSKTDRKISVDYLRRNLSEVVGRAQFLGEGALVSKNNRPVMRIVPVKTREQSKPASQIALAEDSDPKQSA